MVDLSWLFLDFGISRIDVRCLLPWFVFPPHFFQGPFNQARETQSHHRSSEAWILAGGQVWLEAIGLMPRSTNGKNPMVNKPPWFIRPLAYFWGWYTLGWRGKMGGGRLTTAMRYIHLNIYTLSVGDSTFVTFLDPLPVVGGHLTQPFATIARLRKLNGRKEPEPCPNNHHPKMKRRVIIGNQLPDLLHFWGCLHFPRCSCFNIKKW